MSQSEVAQQDSALSAQPPTGIGWPCPTCGTHATSNFCPICGEKKSGAADFSLHHFFTHALGEFFHFDSKIFRTCRLLFTRPGFLTAEYLRGCRKPYLHPFQLFFIANLIYFLAQPYIGWSGLRTTLSIQTHMMSYSDLATRMVAARVADKGIPLEQFTHSFDHVVDVQARSLAVLMVPIFAVVLAVLQWRKRRFFGEHLVFSLHFTAFWLVSLFILFYGATALIFRFALSHGVVLSVLNSDRALSPIAALILLVYTTVALRVVYRDSIVICLVKAAVLATTFHYVLDIYRFILFLTALYLS